MNQAVKDELDKSFPVGEADKVRKFLDKGFSNNGQVVIASIFLRAQEQGKKTDDILEQCDKELERNWKYQHPAIRGDPDAPGNAGIQNRRSLENIYSAMNMLSPLTEEGKEAKNEKKYEGIQIKDLKRNDVIRIRTKNHIYVLKVLDPEAGKVEVTSNGPHIPNHSILCIDGCSQMGIMKHGLIIAGYRLEIGDWTLSTTQQISVNNRPIIK
jgi:hypothetical protein